MNDPRYCGWALITGASSGLGAEFAKIAAKRGYGLVLTARRMERLENLRDELDERFPGRPASVLVCADLAKPDAPERVFDAAVEAGAVPSVLVNNAGFGHHGFFGDADPGFLADMIGVNCAALTRLCRRFLHARTLTPGSGSPDGVRGADEPVRRILNVASVAAFQPGPFMAVYYATKAYVLSLSEALDAECRVHGPAVTVTALCPGPFRTEFQERAGIVSGAVSGSDLFPGARVIAEYGWKAMERGRRVAVPGGVFAFYRFVQPLVPRRLLTSAVARLQRSRFP